MIYRLKKYLKHVSENECVPGGEEFKEQLTGIYERYKSRKLTDEDKELIKRFESVI